MRIFITHIVPPGKEIETSSSFAACNFSRNLNTGDLFEKVYSIMTPGIHQRFENEDNIEYVCSFIRLLGRPFWRIALLFEQLILLYNIPRNSSVWFYNLTTLTERLYKLIKKFKPSVKLYIIILDFII